MSRLKRYAFPLILGTAFLAACDQAAIVTEPQEDPQVTTRTGDPIPGRYIVVMEPDALAGKKPAEEASGLALEFGIEPDFVYGTAIAGFAGPLSETEVDRLREDERVSYVEQDRWVVLDPITIMGPKPGRGKPGNGGGNDPQETPWGITRVGGGSGSASGVAWVLDTGIDLDHPDLNVDASRGFSAFSKGRDAGMDDRNGHGTHVAGTIGGVDNSIGVIGVAPGATVVPVKVLDRRGSGSYSGIIAGVNHVAANGQSGDVANMSLGGGRSQALNDAVVAASASVKFALAAGNEAQHAGNVSPASANGINIVTISAIDSYDNFASFSNYGNPPVDWAAPGVSVKSTWKDGGYNTISGTSMAAPHAAGLMLLGPIQGSGTAKNDPDDSPDPIASH